MEVKPGSSGRIVCLRSTPQVRERALGAGRQAVSDLEASGSCARHRQAQERIQSLSP